MEDIFIYLAVSVFLIISSSIILKNIFYRDGKKNSKDIKKTIEELCCIRKLLYGGIQKNRRKPSRL